MPVKAPPWAADLHSKLDELPVDARAELTKRWLERMLYDFAPAAFRAAGLVNEAMRFNTLSCSAAVANETVGALGELRDCVHQSPLWLERTNPGCSSLRAARSCAASLAKQLPALVVNRSPHGEGDGIHAAASLLVQMALWVDVANATSPTPK